jgi:hypothetical protein
MRKIDSVRQSLGYRMPIICKPEELMGGRAMWEDPIVAEVHRIREELAARFNYDILAMFADMRNRQAGLGSRLVSLAKPAEPTDEADRGRHPDSPEATSSKLTPAV